MPICVDLCSISFILLQDKEISFNIILEYGVRKTFTDYLDDVSKTYPQTNGGNIADITNASYEMSDPTGTHKLSEDRGDPNKKDWYSFAGITLSFKLNNNTKDCISDLD